MLIVLDSQAELKKFIDESCRKAVANTFTGEITNGQLVPPVEKKAKKSVERASKQPRRDEVCAKVAAAKEMCRNIFAASSATVAAGVECANSPTPPAPVHEYPTPLAQPFAELLSGSLETANYNYNMPSDNLPVSTILYISVS